MLTSSKLKWGVLSVVFSLGLSACQTTSGVGDGNWKPLGESSNQNVRHDLDSSSIQKNGNTVTYRARSTVKDVRLESTPNLPVFKTAINTYQMQCRERQYRIVNAELYNAQGVMIAKQAFDAKVVQNQLITAGSAAQKQYEAVCQ